MNNALPWALDEREKVLIGVNFSTTKRRPDDWVIERMVKKGQTWVLLAYSREGSTHDGTHDGTHDSTQVRKLILCIAEGTLGMPELMTRLGINTREYIRKKMIVPAIAGGYVERTLPDKLQSKDQAYYLTEKGLALLEELKNQ